MVRALVPTCKSPVLRQWCRTSCHLHIVMSCDMVALSCSFVWSPSFHQTSGTGRTKEANTRTASCNSSLPMSQSDAVYIDYSSIRPQIAKACKRFFWAAPCIGSSSNFYMRYIAACLHYAHSQRQHPAPAPNLHHAHNQQPGGTLCPPQHQHPAPARQLTAPHARTASTRHPVSTTRTAS